MRNAVIALSLLPFTIGCSYLKNRGNDFLDIWQADVGGYFGLGVDFQITDLCHSGLGGGWTAKFGLRKRTFDIWPDNGGAFLVGRLFKSYGDELRGGQLWNFIYIGRYFNQNPEEIKLYRIWNRKRPLINILDVDIGVQALLGIRLGISPGEMIDFFLGWFGLDIALDDTFPIVPKEQENREESLNF